MKRLSMSIQADLAYQDFIESIRKYKLWVHLGWSDIQSRYKGSVLGPFWITLSMTIFILAFGIIYSRLFHQDLTQYIPFLTCGILLWTYISTILLESCDVFLNSKNFICQIKLPFMIYIYRIVWRNFIIFLHNSLVLILVAAYFHFLSNIKIFLFIPGFLLLTLVLVCFSLLIGIIATRYRDIPPIISSILQIVFFVSPITWNPNLLSINSKIVWLNPVTYFMDLVRSPLLGTAPQLSTWLVCLSLTLLCFLIVSPLFVKNRRNIAFWL